MRQRIRAIRAQRDGGFTLIELLITILILGVLAGIVVFSVANFNDDGKVAACKAEVKTVEIAAEAYYAKQKPNAWPAGATDEARIKALVTAGYLKEDPSNIATMTLDATNGKVVSTACDTEVED
jgi:prepilin-type N-terminal cleavage/methylation domain-containing protein